MFSGCQAKEPSLSQKAAARVKEVQGILAGLAPGLADPIAQRNLEKINAILKDSFAAGQKAGLPLRRVGVADNLAVVLTDYPLTGQVTGMDFSKYDVVIKNIKNQSISQERLYLDNKLEIFLICAPFLDRGKVVGAVWLSLEAAKVRESWGISTEEFLGIDFNK